MLKPLGELTITASVIHQYGHSSEGLKLLEFCWNEFEQGNMLYNILQNHKGLINLGSYYNYFKKVNKKNEDLENIIQEIIEIRGIRYIDPHPWGLLELAMGFSSDPFRSPWQVKHLFKKTWLWALPDPWIINDTLAYSLTHTVFFVTHFGTYPYNIPNKYRKYLQLWTPMWIQYFYDRKNYDVMGELIMVIRCINVLNNLQFDKILCKAQIKSGIIPGPYKVQIIEPYVKNKQRKLFLENYHTTLVGIMASCISSYRLNNN